MKLSVKFLLISSLVALFLGGCAVGSSKSRISSKTYSIKFIPQGASGTLEVKTSNKGCKSNPHNGCMSFDVNTVGLIRLYLPGRGRTCNEGARNVITMVELATTGASAKGDFTDLPVKDWLKNEAFAGLVLATGIVHTSPVTEASSEVWLLNANANDASLGAKDFWYRVTAQNCTLPASTWETDPRGRNGGIRR